MKLIGTPTSPYTRKARVVLAEKRIDTSSSSIAPFDAATGVPAYNPLGKVPVLVLDDATTIFDSRVIVEYLDNASPVTKLMPEDTRHRIQARRWEALADGCTDAIVAIVMERRRPQELQYGRWIARQQGKIERALQVDVRRPRHAQLVLRRLLQPRPTSRSAAVSAFSTCACPMSTWRAAYPNLAKLAEKLAQRAVVQGHVPPRSLTAASRGGARAARRGTSGGPALKPRSFCADSMMPPPRHTRLS